MKHATPNRTTDNRATRMRRARGFPAMATGRRRGVERVPLGACMGGGGAVNTGAAMWGVMAALGALFRRGRGKA